MLCPNCSETMKSDYYDNQYVGHCSSCGASFFEPNGINRITFDTALKLSEDRYKKSISPKEKVCPKDFTPFTSISNSQAVPSNVILFECPICAGVFVYPDDLLKFKKAQGAKIDYFKTWQRPFESVQSVLIIFVILLLSTATFITFNASRNKASIQSEASGLFKTLSIIKSAHYILIGFQTNIPLRSQIIITNSKDDKSIVKDISPDFKTSHQIVISDLIEGENYTYKLVLTDRNGGRIETQVKKLVTTR